MAKKFAMARPMHHSVSVSSRPIANGFISSVSHNGPTGYKDTERFHKTDPMKHTKGPVATAMNTLKAMQQLRKPKAAPPSASLNPSVSWNI